MAKQYTCTKPTEEDDGTWSLVFSYEENAEHSDIVLFGGQNASWLCKEYHSWKTQVDLTEKSN